MKKSYKKKVILSIVFVVINIVLLGGWYWMNCNNLRFVQHMGTGINVGNSLDATNLWNYKPEATELDHETFWGNPKVSLIQFQTIYRAGFRTVRIPVTWQNHMDEQGNISNVWMDRVQEVVDMALSEHLYVIINTHHETWLDLQIENKSQMTERFCYIWNQIATRFQGYDEHLLFEGMNEPRLRDSEHEWDAGTPEMRALVNRMNVAFVKTVRDIEGNKERYLLIGAYATSSYEEALKELEVPKGNIIVSVHAYLPYRFSHDVEGTKEWSATNLEDTREIDEAFQSMHRYFVKKGIPVILSEFGCVDKNNLESRVAWTKFYKKMAKELGVSCIWWDNGNSFQLLDRENGKWVYPELVDALVGE